MKTCPRCRSEFEDRFKFCPECGAASETSAASSSEVSMGEKVTIVGGRGAETGDRGGGRGGVSVGDGPTMVGGRRTETGDRGADVGEQGSDGRGKSVEERYELLEEIGRGGFARVWKARDRRLGRTVAVKRLLAEALGGAGGVQTLARFRREAQAIAQLNHRNIVAVYDHDRDAVGDYIVMEYVEGGTLRDYLKAKGGALPVPEAVSLARGVAQGLAYAHRKNLVHRDIKPGNILLHAEDGATVPKISDFGLARVGGDTDVSKSGYGMGTQAYMPPEQRRDAKTVNHTADIFALGKTLYEMVTGDLPDNVDPGKIPPAQGLAEVIFTCIKSNPEERFFSAEDLVRVLDRGGVEGGAASKGPPNENVCLTCGTANAADAKFCENCGAGMTQPCPECGRENSIRKQFCGGCGSDMEGFLKWRKALARLEEMRNEKRWSRVIKESGLLTEARLPGPKGMELVRKVAAVTGEAKEAVANRDRFRREAEGGLAAARIGEALRAAEACLTVDPHQEDVRKLVETLQKLSRLDAERRGKLAEGNFDGADAALAEMASNTLPTEGERLLREAHARERADRQEMTERAEMLENGRHVLETAELREKMRNRWPRDMAVVTACERATARRAQLNENMKEARSLAGAYAWQRVREHATAALRLDPGYAPAAELLAQAENGVRSIRNGRRLTGIVFVAVVVAFWAYLRARAIKRNSVIQKAALELAARGEYERAVERMSESRNAAWLLAFKTGSPREWEAGAASAKKARQEKLAAWVSAAWQAQAAKDWHACLDKAVKALALDPGHVEAQTLKSEAERNLAPTLTLTAVVAGKEIVAEVSDGDRVWKTPATISLGAGKTYTFKVSSAPRKTALLTTRLTPVKCYKPETLTITADWEGTRLRRVLLEENHNPIDGQDWTSPSTGMAFVWIPALKIWVGKFEVTNGEYRKKEPDHDSGEYKGYTLNDDWQPVANMSFDKAKEYAVWLTERDCEMLGADSGKLRYRLPKGKEWLVCAQCGDGRKYPWGNTMPPKWGNYSDSASAVSGTIDGYTDGYAVTCPVQRSGLNEWGLYGIGGNVYECCLSDWSKSDSFGAWRGASWVIDPAYELRCEHCNCGSTKYGKYCYGFRLVLLRPSF